MKLRRLLKLAKMSPAEVRGRCGVVLRRRREKAAWSRGEPSPAPIASDGLLASAAALVIGASRHEASSLQRDAPRVHAAAAERALNVSKAVTDGRLTMLGHRFDLRGAIDWHADPRSGYRWPRTFYADLPIYAGLPAGVDVKYVWELGRHHYLCEAAKAWLLTGDETSAVRVREIILCWIHENPLYEGVHWTSPLEAAMRSISWIWSLAFLAGWRGWSPTDLATISAALAAHARYLERHLSFYESPYNHLIGEASALFLLGHLPAGAEGDRWQARGRQVLEEHGPRQFYADGFCVEQATGYHFYTLGFLALAVVAARHARQPLQNLEPFVHRAFQAGLSFRRPDGRWPAIGDADSARSIPVLPDDFWNFDSLCNLGAVLFDDPTLKTPTDACGEETCWLLGSVGVRCWERMPTPTPQPSAILKGSGYAVARRAGDWLLFDAGPIAAGLFSDATPSVAHGHADALQVQYAFDGFPVFDDLGMPFYGGPAEWVDHFRSAAAHNVVEVDGAGPVRPAGKLAWSHAERAPGLQVDFSDEAWLASGVADWRPDVHVERHLLALPGCGLWVADLVETAQPRRATLHWHLSSRFAGRTRLADDGASLALDDSTLSVRSDAPFTLTVVDGPSESSVDGWECPEYGVKRPAPVARFEFAPATRHFFLTFFGKEPQPVEVVVAGRRLSTSDRPASDDAGSFRLGTTRWRVGEAGRATPRPPERSPSDRATAKRGPAEAAVAPGSPAP